MITTIDAIILAYKSGMTITRIAEITERSRRCIVKLLKSEGVKFRTHSETMLLVKRIHVKLREASRESRSTH